MSKYRIINDHYLGYEVQILQWWWPWWCGIGSTYATVEKAREFAKGHAGGVVEHLGKWTPTKGE